MVEELRIEPGSGEGLFVTAGKCRGCGECGGADGFETIMAGAVIGERGRSRAETPVVIALLSMAPAMFYVMIHRVRRPSASESVPQVSRAHRRRCRCSRLS
jgi:hypothetical protein